MGCASSSTQPPSTSPVVPKAEDNAPSAEDKPTAYTPNSRPGSAKTPPEGNGVVETIENTPKVRKDILPPIVPPPRPIYPMEPDIPTPAEQHSGQDETNGENDEKSPETKTDAAVVSETAAAEESEEPKNGTKEEEQEETAIPSDPKPEDPIEDEREEEPEKEKEAETIDKEPESTEEKAEQPTEETNAERNAEKKDEPQEEPKPSNPEINDGVSHQNPGLEESDPPPQPPTVTDSGDPPAEAITAATEAEGKGD